MTLATTVAAEDECSESSIDGVRHQLAFCGGLESNLKLSVKPSSRRSSSEQSIVRLFQDRRQASCATNEFLVARLPMRLTSTKRLSSDASASHDAYPTFDVRPPEAHGH